MTEARQPDTPTRVGSSEELGADELLRAFGAAAKREARDQAEIDVWDAVAEKVAEGDMDSAWSAIADRLGDDRHAVIAVLGLFQWMVNTGRVNVEHGVDDAEIPLPATCCDQMDADCIGIRLSKPHGTLWIEAPNVNSGTDSVA